MAGDWLPIRLDLHDDPAVLAIAGATGLDEFAVVGRLLKLWGWANLHTVDGNAQGNARGVTETWIDRYLTAPGFAAAMLSAGWLSVVPDAPAGVVCLPKFDRWNSQGAKQRALTARRVAAFKARSIEEGNAESNAQGNAQGNAASVTGALPKEEKRKRKNKDTPQPPAEAGGGVCDEPGTGPPTPDLPADPNPDPEPVAPWADLTAVWTAARLAGHDLPQGIQRTANRVGHWQTRLRDPTWAARWREAVKRAGASARCRGAVGTWKLTIDAFVSKPDMLVRIMEGEFDDDDAGRNGTHRRGRGSGDKPGRYGHLGRTSGAPPPGPAAGGGAGGETGRTAADLFRPPGAV